MQRVIVTVQDTTPYTMEVLLPVVEGIIIIVAEAMVMFMLVVVVATEAAATEVPVEEEVVVEEEVDVAVAVDAEGGDIYIQVRRERTHGGLATRMYT